MPANDKELREQIADLVLFIYFGKPIRLNDKQVDEIMQLVSESMRRREGEARLDEREHMKFIKESTGEETHLPFTQYRYMDDGLLLNWSDRTEQLKATIRKEGAGNT